MLDVNALFLEGSLGQLRREYPRRDFRGVVGDFTTDLGRLGPGGGRLTMLFGGTVGNLYPGERRAFFQDLARGMEASDALLLGVDLLKDAARLEAAYDDPEGVTAEFNRNVLHVLNRELGANFDPACFHHVAVFDTDHEWIEMRLRAIEAQEVALPAIGLTVSFAAGEEMRTEISAKFTRERVAAELAAAGLSLSAWHTDPNEWFALSLSSPSRRLAA
jgi:L-histidine N-alpha-methyltransferase